MLSTNRLCQIEIQVSNLERSRLFYQTVFGWGGVPAELFEYVILEVPPDSLFGISLLKVPGATQCTSRVTLFLKMQSQAEVDAVLRQVHSLEPANAPRKPRQIPGYGAVWLFSDPDGQVWGLFLRN